MNSNDDDTEEAEVYAATDKMTQPTSDIPGTGDIHTLYERRAQQYLQLSDGGKALANAVKAVEYRNDSFTAHWLAGKSYVSMAMYDPGICALSTAIELCCFEDKQQEILIDLLVHYCSRKNELSGATGVFRKISGHTWATVAYKLTKTRRFNAAYIAYSQLQKVGKHPSDIHFDLQPLCDIDAVTAEPWILDLVTCFLRYGSDHNTITSQAGDTYIHGVVRMSLAAGVLSLLEYVLGNVVHPGELRGLLDCLGNSALHMAAQCQKCSALVRLDVMTLLVEAGVDETARNIEGKTAGSYLSGNEEDCLQSHHEYNLICSGLMAKKMKQAVDKIYDNVDNVRREDDTEEFQESTQDKHIQVQEKQTIERTFDATPKTHSKEDDAPDNNTVENTTDLLLQKMMTVGLAQNCNLSSRIQDAHKYNDSGQSLETIAEENSFQYETTNNQRQPVPVTEEEEMPVREPQISVSQGIDGESSRNFNTDVQITNRCLPVESVPDKPKLIEFNLETIKIDLQNGLPEQQVISITEKASNTCEVSQVDINSENVHVNVVKTYHVSDDVGDDNSSFGSLEHNKSCGSDMEVEVSLNKSTIQSSQYSKKQLQSSDVLRDRAACAALQYAGTDKDNDGIKYTASIHVQASLFGSIAPYNNDNVSVGITSIQKNDYRDHDEIQVAPKFNDNPETENKAENESNCSELGQDVTRNDTMVKSSQESVTQSHKLSKKSPEVLKEKDANDENIDVQSLLNKDILLKHIAPDDNSSPVLIKVHDDDNSQAQKKAETKSSGSEIGYGVSHKDIMSKFSQDSLTKQQDVLQEESLSEKFQCGNTCAIPLEDMVSNDNGCRHPFDQVETVNLDLKNGLPQQQVYPITGKSSYNECETNTTPQHRSQFFQLAPVETKTKPVAKKPGKCKQTQRSSTKETKEQKVFEDTSSYQDNKHEQCCPAEKTSETSESCLSYNMDEDKMLTLPEQGTDQIQVTLDSPVRARENQMTSLQNGPELMVSKERPYFLQTHVSKRTELRNFQMMSKHDHTEEDSTDSEHINENENICNDISSTTVGELTSTTDANGKSKSYGCAPTKQSHYGETEEKIALDKRYDQTFNRKRPISKRRDLCLEIKHLISDIQNPPSIFYREAEKEDDATEKNKDFGEDSSNTEMYDCTNGVLELECTEEFWKTMCSDQMPLDIKRRALRILKQLASGEKCHYRNSPSNENIFKAKILPEVYIIWGTARVYSHRLNNSDETEMRRDLGTKHPKVIYSEVIRIWDIVRGSEEMEKCTKRLKEISQRHNRCLQQTHLTGQVTKLSQRAYIPSIFTVSESQDVSNVISVPKYLRRQNGIQKFYLISPEMIRCFIQSNLSNVTFPFRLSKPERDIVDLQSDLPVFLLGENGSGKTTCCMYRLLQIWLANRKTSTAGSGPNAIDESADFNGSDENDTYLCQSTETDTKFAEADIGENNILRPIFITKDRWKAKEAKEIFLGLCCGSDPSPKNINRKEQELPESFQNASNDICPLFLTMQQFLFILDSSLGEPKFFEGNKADMNSWVNVLDTLELGHPSVPVKGKLLRQVTYEVFRDEVWPKLGKAFDGKYDLSFVWIEILNHIAGSIEAISQRSGILTKEQYVGKARLRTVYSKEDLSHIYDMFKRYDNLKTQKGYFDVTDLLHSIMTRIQTEPSVPFVFQHIFADDVQDFNSAEISLLLSFSSEPNTVFLSGTQKEHHVSISDGVVKLLHFNGTHRSLVAIQPLIKYLPNEFGPSEGISSFANCIMHLMKDTSSYPLDAVEDKTSLFPGPRPVLLNSHNEIDLLDFLTVYRSTGLKLGANQVILVRDEHSRNNIPPKMKNSLILTLEEASGLRFDDVLLYNFFADSKVGKDIILLTKMDGKFENRKKKHDVDGNQTKMAKWDRFRRASLQRELQALYKASMTASNNLWIFDENSYVASSMYTYLQERNVAEVHQTAEYGQRRVSESTPKEWMEACRGFVHRDSIALAARCLTLGGHTRMTFEMDCKDTSKMLLVRALCCLKCNLTFDAVKWLRIAGEWSLLAQLYVKCGQIDMAADVYQTNNYPIEASKCYEDMNMFDIAVDILCETKHYDRALETFSRYRMYTQDIRSRGKAFPAVLIEHKPLQTQHDLNYMAACFYHNNYDEQSMMKCVERFELLDDSVAFLKQHDHFVKAAELLKKRGKYVEATHLYIFSGKSKLALEIARQSRNKDLIGECLIVDAQVMMRKKPENKLSDEQKKAQKDEVLQILQEAIDILLHTSNQELRGEASFLKGEITNEVTDINESWGAFNKCNPRCEAGQLECVDWIIRNSDLDNFQNLLQVVKGMDNLFGVLNILVSSDKAGGDRVYKYYGLRPTSEGNLKMFPFQNPRALNIMKRCLNKAKRKNTEYEVSRNVGRDEICRFLLDRGHYWYGEVTLALNKLKKQREQCREFILGRNCTKAADGGKCFALHDIMTESALKNLIDVDLLHLEMDWYVQQGCDRLLEEIALDLVEMVNVLLPDTANDHMARYKSCEVLLHHLMPRERFPFRMTEKGRVQANKLQEHICNTYVRNEGEKKVRKHLKDQMVCFLNTKFNYMKTQERKTNTDVFMKLCFLTNYLQLKHVDTSNLMMEFETEVRNELLQRNPSKIRKKMEPLGFLVDDKDMRNISVQCVARQFCEAYYHLTIPADPLEVLIKFTKFILILGDRNKTAILPEFSDFLMWTEYFTTIAVCFGAKNNQVTNVFFLPASYLSLVYFIDSSFQINGQSTFELIQRHKKSWGHNLTLSQERAERIISVLCGSGIRMNLIRVLFKLREDRATDYGLAERLLVLCMTILCNMGMALFANKEADLVQQLCLIALPEDCPKRLLKAVCAVQEAEGLSDIAAALKELLHDRDQEHVCLCHWSSSDRYGVKSTPLDKLAFLPSKFFDPNTKKKMTNPGQGRLATEEDEDVVANSLAELDTDMTMEEKFKWESEQKTFQENRRKENAAWIITRFFKKIRFRFQCSILHCLVEEELQKEQTKKRLKKFQQFGIDDRACTICDVIFDKPSGNLIEGQSYATSPAGSNPSPGNEQTHKSHSASLLNPFSALFSNSGQAPSVEDWPKVSETSDDPTASLDETGDNQHSEENSWRAKQKLKHEQSLSHTKNMTDFKQLKLTYKTQIAARQEEIVEFIRKHNLKSEKGLQNYADMKLDLTRLVNQSDIAQNEFERILAKRDWGNSRLFTQYFHEANGCFLNVRPYVEEQWRKLHESKDKAAESLKARSST